MIFQATSFMHIWPKLLLLFKAMARLSMTDHECGLKSDVHNSSDRMEEVPSDGNSALHLFSTQTFISTDVCPTQIFNIRLIFFSTFPFFSSAAAWVLPFAPGTRLFKRKAPAFPPNGRRGTSH
jgi:hypothetical protein